MDSLYNVLLGVGLSQRWVNKRLDWCFSKNSCMYYAHTHTPTPVSVRLLLYTRHHALGKSCTLSKKDTFLNCICSEYQRGLKGACSFCGLCYSVHNYKLDPETFKAAVSSDVFYMMVVLVPERAAGLSQLRTAAVQCHITNWKGQSCYSSVNYEFL